MAGLTRTKAAATSAGNKLVATTATNATAVTVGKSYRLGNDGKAHRYSTVVEVPTIISASAIETPIFSGASAAVQFDKGAGATACLYLPNGDWIVPVMTTNLPSPMYAVLVNGDKTVYRHHAYIGSNNGVNQSPMASFHYLGTYTYGGVTYYNVGHFGSYYRNSNNTWYVFYGTLTVNTTTNQLTTYYFTSADNVANIAPADYGFRAMYGGTTFHTARNGKYVVLWRKNTTSNNPGGVACNIAPAYTTGSNFAAIPALQSQTQQYIHAAHNVTGEAANAATTSHGAFYAFKYDDANGKFITIYPQYWQTGHIAQLVTITDAGQYAGTPGTITQTGWTTVSSNNSLGVWFQITSTTYARVYMNSSQWVIQKFTYDPTDGTNGSLTMNTNSGLQTLADLELGNTGTVETPTNNLNSAHLQDGEKLFVWSTDDNTKTFEFNLNSCTLVGEVSPTMNGLPVSGANTDTLGGRLTSAGNYQLGMPNTRVGWSGHHGVWDPAHFDSTLKTTTHAPLIATASSDSGATGNFMLKPGLSSDTALSTTYYCQKEDMYYPYDEDQTRAGGNFLDPTYKRYPVDIENVEFE